MEEVLTSIESNLVPINEIIIRSSKLIFRTIIKKWKQNFYTNLDTIEYLFRPSNRNFIQ